MLLRISPPGAFEHLWLGLLFYHIKVRGLGKTPRCAKVDSERWKLEQKAHVSLKFNMDAQSFSPAVYVVVILSTEEFMIFCNFLFLLIQQC